MEPPVLVYQRVNQGIAWPRRCAEHLIDAHVTGTVIILAEERVSSMAICKAYFSGLNFREYPQQNMARNMVLTVTFTYLHQLDPEDLPLITIINHY